MNPETLLEHLDRRVPHFEASGQPELLSGGYLNHVWRVPGRPAPVIVKYAPPHIASRPDVPLDPNRIAIEARCLAAFEPGGVLAQVGSPAVRPPRLVDFCAREHILVMEDIGACPDLGTWLWRESCLEGTAEELGRQLGAFIGTLHRHTSGDPGLARAFDNRAIQRARLDVQYAAIGELCEKAALPDADTLGRRAVELGERLQEPGLCVIMGDLWPPSIRMTTEGVRLIDWELAHYGRPSQDVGHLVAHLWMYAHRAPNVRAAARTREALYGFLDAYRDALGVRFGDVFGKAGTWESAVHVGAEILVRAIGGFKEGYLYEGLPLDDALVQEAVSIAAWHIRSPDRVDTLVSLRS